MIIDGHGHISATSFGSVEGYLAALAESGVDGGVVCAGGMLDVRRMNDFVFGDKAPERRPRNDYVEQALRKHRSLAGLCFVDPTDPSAKDELCRRLDQGFRGMFVSPLIHPFSFTDKALVALCQICADRDLTVVSHNGWRPGSNTPDYASLAKAVPRCRFVLEHMGAPPADVDARKAAAELPNFYLETSLGSFLHIAETLKEAGAEKLVYGSEYPLSHPGVELAKLLHLTLSDEERELIFCENARRLFHLDLDAVRAGA
ncbi:MAG: amidohydrolase family protein [Polyangiaceae bacterium]